MLPGKEKKKQKRKKISLHVDAGNSDNNVWGQHGVDCYDEEVSTYSNCAGNHALTFSQEEIKHKSKNTTTGSY